MIGNIILRSHKFRCWSPTKRYTYPYEFFFFFFNGYLNAMVWNSVEMFVKFQIEKQNMKRSQKSLELSSSNVSWLRFYHPFGLSGLLAFAAQHVRACYGPKTHKSPCQPHCHPVHQTDSIIPSGFLYRVPVRRSVVD